MPKLKFYDLKAKKVFYTDKYVTKTKGKVRFAVATAPSGVKSWRIIGRKKK